MKKLILLSILFMSVCYGIVINVPDDATGIQVAISASSDGDTVLVSPGIYVENIAYHGKKITVGSLFITTGDTSYISQTQIDGNRLAPVVRFHDSEDSTSVLSGFTIKNGKGLWQSHPLLDSSPDVYYFGGGIFIWRASPNINNLIITNNEADFGGGICIAKSDLTYIWKINNIQLRNNLAVYSGAGIYLAGKYSNNIDNELIIFDEMTFSSNFAMGGVSEGGAGIFVDRLNDCNLHIENSLFDGNKSVINDGGAILMDSGDDSLKIFNTVFVNNIAGDWGGAIAEYDGFVDIQNATFHNNFANTGNAVYSSNYRAINSIFTETDPLYIDDEEEATVYYSLISSEYDGTGNIDDAPTFVDADNGDFSLDASSPCIDAGAQDPVFNDTDGTQNDMGSTGGPGEYIELQIGCDDTGAINYLENTNLLICEYECDGPENIECSENYECNANGTDPNYCECSIDIDCNGECGGSAIEDECGVCGGDGIPDGACDCAGNVELGCGCGEAGPSGCDSECGSIAELDECGVCGGDGIPDGACDCAGNVELGCECGSIAELDECGVCGGNGWDYCDDDEDGISNLEQWGYGPYDLSINDIPNDQGGYVYVSFSKSLFDTNTLDANIDPDGKGLEGYLIERMDNGVWTSTVSIFAYGSDSYQVETTTLTDSTSVSGAINEYRVIAAMMEGNFVSNGTATGYSVDNIAPETPTSLSGVYDESENKAILLWDSSEANDISHYNIYINTEFYTIATETSFIDEITTDTEYSVSAVDIHENESVISEVILVSMSLTIIDNLMPTEYALIAAYPNPFNPITKITYGLPENEDVHISVYNMTGTQVTSLVNTFETAGYHTISWNASSYPSGVYLIRMDSGDFTQTQKVVLVK